VSATARHDGDQKDSRERVHFNIEEAQSDLYRKWARPDTAERAERRVFESISSMFVFAAALAFARMARRPMAGTKRDVFRWSNLDDESRTLLRSIALAAPGGGIDVLAYQGSVADIVEEYAAAGVDILRAELGDDPNRDRAVETLARLACEAAVVPRS
jgi:uncharacterized protein YPO0396